MSSLMSEVIRYVLTLLFGVFVSAAIADIRHTKKNLVILSVFCLCNLLIQSILIRIGSLALVTSLYPLITHLPLFLLFLLVFHKRVLPSILAITTAYLCCQICNWMSTVPEYLLAPAWTKEDCFCSASYQSFIMYLIILLRYTPDFYTMGISSLQNLSLSCCVFTTILSA